jgi:hypothetical protein
MDARQLCLRLQQYSSGNHDALRPIRVPTAEQVRARSEVTLRGQAPPAPRLVAHAAARRA